MKGGEIVKKFVKPMLFDMDFYLYANDGHCHQVKDECSPYQAK
jgi:hypothetical protein